MIENKIIFEKERSVAETVNTSLEFIKTNIKTLFRDILFIAGPAILISSLMLGLFQTSVQKFSQAKKPGGFGSTKGMTSNFVNIGMTGMLFSLLAFFLMVGVVYKFLQVYRKEGSLMLDVKNIWKAIRKDWWFLLKTCIGLMITLVVSFTLIMLCLFAMIYFVGSSGNFGGEVYSGILIFILICGIILLMLYILSPLALIFNIRIFERKRFFPSLKRAYQLVNGKRWKTVGIVLICFIIQMMVSLVFYIPTFAALMVNQFSRTEWNIAWLAVIFYVLLLIMGYLINIVSIVAMNFHYFSIVEEKEAAGLLSRISMMQSKVSTNDVK